MYVTVIAFFVVHSESLQGANPGGGGARLQTLGGV